MYIYIFYVYDKVYMYMYILNVCVCVCLYTHIYIYTYVQYNKIQYSTILHTRSLAHTHNITLYYASKGPGLPLFCIPQPGKYPYIYIIFYDIVCFFYNKKNKKVLGFSSSASRGRASIRGALLSARLRYASEIRSLLYV